MYISKTGKGYRTVLCFVIAAAMLIGSLFVLPQSAYGNTKTSEADGNDLRTLQPYAKPGLVFMGEKINGNKGFDDDILFLSEDEVEGIKDAQSGERYSLGESYVKNKIFSSYEDHGSGSFHYSIVDGLDINKMLAVVVDGGITAVKNYFVTAADGYTQNISYADTQILKYFAPGDTVGTPAPDPIIALYKTTEESANQNDGIVPQTAEKLSAGDNVLLFGQTGVMDNNNCKFIHQANIISVNSTPAPIRSTSKKAYVGLSKLMQAGIYKTDYSFMKNGSTVTHNVEGIPLTYAVEELGLVPLMPDFTQYKLRIERTDGSFKNIDRADIDKCFIAWDYTDDMDTPAAQAGDYIVYMPGTTEDDTVIYNAAKINVVSNAGQTVTAKVVKPAAPGRLTAARSSYSSINLSWSKVSGADGYYVYRYDSKTKKYKIIKTVTGGSRLSFTNTSLTTGTKYYYKVSAYKSRFGDRIEGSLTGSKYAVPTLGRPTLSKLTRYGKKSVKLTWKKVSGASGYVIYRATGKTGKYKKITTIKKGSIVKYTNKKLTKGKKYYYKIKAYRVVNGSKKYSSFSGAKYIKR